MTPSYHSTSPSPIIYKEILSLGICVTSCQHKHLEFSFQKHLPLRKSIQWQNSNIPADATIQRKEKYEKP